MYSSVSRSDDVDGRSGSGSVATAAPRNSCCGIVRQHRPRWTNAICLLTAFIFAVNGGVLLVVIPTLARELDTTIEVAAWTNIAPMFISAMIATQMGKIADQYGRARMWHVGMTLELLSHAASGGAQSMGQLLIARVVGGLGMGVGAGSAFGLMAAGLPPKQRGVAAAWLMLMGTLGRTSGTSIGTSPDPLCQRFRCLPLHNKRYFQSGASAQEGS
jgi:MFS family permease